MGDKETRKLYSQISEAAFTSQMIALARWHKWRVAHFRPALTQRGRWVTPVAGDGAGFPDLVLSRRERLIFAELKTGRGKTTPAQDIWLESLRGAPVEVYLWRPGDIEEIERILK